MAEWIICPACRHRHPPRSDRSCPRCHKRIEPRARMPLARAAPRPLRASPPRGRPWLAAALTALVVFGLPLAAQRWGRFRLQYRQVEQRARLAYPDPIEPLPELDAAAFFREQHERCFGKAYTLSWVWSTFDQRAYVGCLERGYRERLGKLATLAPGAWGPHSDPRWAKLEYTVTLREGRLPRKPSERYERDCSGAQSSGEGQSDISFFKPAGEGVYVGSTLVFLEARPCRYRLFLLYERWPIAEPLSVTTPTPDPMLMQARVEQQALERQAEERSFACIDQTRRAASAAPAGEPSAAVARAIEALRDSSVSVREQALRDLARLGPAARPALPAIVASLTPGYVQTKGYAIEALAAIDPERGEAGPVLKCLLLQPSPYVRQAAAAALGKLGDPDGVSALVRELDSAEPSTRLSAVRRFRDLGAHGKNGAAALAARLAADPVPEIRKECASTLPWLDPASTRVAEALKAAAERDADAAVRGQAQLALRDLESLKRR
jgi:hypothetical protein